MHCVSDTLLMGISFHVSFFQVTTQIQPNLSIIMKYKP